MGEAIISEQVKKKTVDSAYEKMVWDMTETIRKQQYPLTQAGYTKDKKKFVSHLEECSPVDVDETVLA